MAKEQNAGSVVYTVSAEIEPLLIAGKQAIDVLDKLDAAAQQSGKGMDSLDQSTSHTGSAFNELAGYANSMDNQLRKLNTNVSGIARAMEEARSGTGGANSEFNRAESIIEALGNQLAILDEAQENGARSAAVLAAQLRAGSKATDEEKAARSAAIQEATKFAALVPMQVARNAYELMTVIMDVARLGNRYENQCRCRFKRAWELENQHAASWLPSAGLYRSGSGWAVCTGGFCSAGIATCWSLQSGRCGSRCCSCAKHGCSRGTNNIFERRKDSHGCAERCGRGDG